MTDASGRQRRRRCYGNRRQHHQQHPVVVLREPRLELCHPDDFHALRDAADLGVVPPVAIEFETVSDATTTAAALPLVCPRHSFAADDRREPLLLLTLGPPPCSACDDENLLPVDPIPLPVHYVAEQDDDDDDDDDDYDDDDDDSGCSDSNYHIPSEYQLAQLLSCRTRTILYMGVSVF